MNALARGILKSVGMVAPSITACLPVLSPPYTAKGTVGFKERKLDFGGPPASEALEPPVTTSEVQTGSQSQSFCAYQWLLFVLSGPVAILSRRIVCFKVGNA